MTNLGEVNEGSGGGWEKKTVRKRKNVLMSSRYNIMIRHRHFGGSFCRRRIYLRRLLLNRTIRLDIDMIVVRFRTLLMDRIIWDDGRVRKEGKRP